MFRQIIQYTEIQFDLFLSLICVWLYNPLLLSEAGYPFPAVQTSKIITHKSVLIAILFGQ